ncbi:MAG: hypothetical protein HKN36_06380 [Hellea sp.]|nr:hypothetical protein [Hellea sp.]
MNIKNLPPFSNLEKWNDANIGKNFSVFDYVHILQKTQSIDPDFILAFVEVCWPEFLLFKDRVFLSDEFSIQKYESTIASEPHDKGPDFWMNLVCIDSIFEELDFQKQKYLGFSMEKMWRAKLNIEFPERDFIVKCIVEENEEVFCVFYQDETS